MARKQSERSRWTTIYTIAAPFEGQNIQPALKQHGEIRAVVEAFEAVGRVVRIEAAKYGQGLLLKARRA